MAIQDLIPWRRQSAPLLGEEWLPLASIQREMNRMFEDFWSAGSSKASMQPTGSFFPCVEISENGKSVEVTAEIPGMTEKDIRVTISDDADTLTIEGEKQSATEKKEETLYRAERTYGHFRRTVALPVRVDSNKVEAKYKNGVLTIHMPKLPSEKQKVHHIPVSAT